MEASRQKDGPDRKGGGLLRGFLPGVVLLAGILAGVGGGADIPRASAGAPEGPSSRETRAVFEHAQDKVFQVRVLLQTTHSQTSTGTCFLVSADGHALTNYHVVSEAALEPDRHRLEYVGADGSRGPLELVAVDVPHDLAVVRMQGSGLPHFLLHAGIMGKGDRGYSVGNPLGVGLSIVEGTYNGMVEDSFYDLIHFTGAINPGMSGGPTVTPSGEVFGINVAIHRRGQLVGYLVPVEYASPLLREIQLKPRNEKPDFRQEINTQLLRHAELLLERLLAQNPPVQSLGSFVVPERPAPFIRCWGSTQRDANKQYEEDSNACGSETGVYVDRGLRVGSVRFEHTLLRPKKLGIWRFARLMGREYGEGRENQGGSRKDFTRFACQEGFLDTGGFTLRTVLCLRAYRRFEGLYDLHLRVVSVNSSQEGMVGKLMLNGVRYELGTAFARRYLESLAWKP